MARAMQPALKRAKCCKCGRKVEVRFLTVHPPVLSGNNRLHHFYSCKHTYSCERIKRAKEKRKDVTEE